MISAELFRDLLLLPEDLLLRIPYAYHLSNVIPPVLLLFDVLYSLVDISIKRDITLVGTDKTNCECASSH